MPADVRATIRALLERCTEVSASEVAEAAGVSRQAAHAHLRQLVAAGELVREGRARATRYRRLGPARRGARLEYARRGLEEDHVWNDVRAELPELSAEAEEIVAYAVTELVNNAVDHSSAERVAVEVRIDAAQLAIAVSDDGVGVFEHIRAELGLEDHLHALQELHKGKLTTMPAEHTGEGIYFTSKAVDRFTLESSGLRWIVDNELPDVAVLDAETAPGTRAEVVVSLSPARTLGAVFAEHTRNFEFARSRSVIKLFAIGVRFVSRSEAKRLLAGLDKFREVVLDFRGVQGVGQAFADEVFRVWARAHPRTELAAVNMSRSVEFMVRRATQREPE